MLIFAEGLEQAETDFSQNEFVNVSYFAQTPARTKDLLAHRPATRATRL
jgi:hypothetical protein